jgi:predicted dehydrogenase
MKKPLKIAFTGTGYISKIHAQAAQSLQASHGVELVAVVNHQAPSRATFAQTYNIPRQYITVEELLSDGDVDALIVSTPNYLHAHESILALQRGVAVMVEKPMAMNSPEALRMQATAQHHNTALMVAHCWRFDPEVLWLKRHIDAGMFGKMIRTKGYGVHTNWGPGGWFQQAKFAGGGALADMGIHAIDTVRFLLGDPQPVSVWAKISTEYGTYDVDDTGVILVNWANGVTSYIESGWWQPYSDGAEASTHMYGTQGYGRIFPTGAVHISPEKNATTLESGFAPVRNPHCPQSLYDEQLRYFVECVQNGVAPNPGSAEGLVNMQIVDAAYRSSQSGKVEIL